jgi:hyperosmotically inducible periplasmic protein
VDGSCMPVSPKVRSGEVFRIKGCSPSKPQWSCERWLEQRKEADGPMRPLSLFKAQAVVGIAVMILAGCSAMTGHQSPSAAVSNSAIITKVKTNLLADSAVGALAIDVDTTDGMVSLNGFMNNAQEWRRAVPIAQSMSGVKRVDARNLTIKRS